MVEQGIPEAVLRIARALVVSGIDLAPTADNEPHEAPETYRVREIAEALKVAESTVYRWINKGKLPAMRLSDGGSVRVAAEDFEAFKRRGLMRAANHSPQTKACEVAS